MRLCFGTFAKIISYCRTNLPQVKFVARIVWVIDSSNRALTVKEKSEANNKVDANDLTNMEGNPTVVSRLVSCDRPLVLRDKQLPSLDVVQERFKSEVIPFIVEDKVSKAIRAILYVISQDETIEYEHKESFKKHLGMYKWDLLSQTKFDAPDFLSRILMYTTCIDNTEGHPYIEEITENFIEEIASDNWVELKWDTAMQTVEIVSAAEGAFFSELNKMSNLRLSLMENREDFVDLGWMDVDERALFPNRYHHIEFGDSEAKRIAVDKMAQYAELVREFTDCLVAKQQLVSGQATEWPLFPDKRMRDIRKQLTELHDELFLLGVVQDRFPLE